MHIPASSPSFPQRSFVFNKIPPSFGQKRILLAPPQLERRRIVDAILQMRLPKMSWKKLRRDIEPGHAGLS
jgi:hypothetical protein